MRIFLSTIVAAMLVVAPMNAAVAQTISKEKIWETLQNKGYSVSEFNKDMIQVDVGEVTVLVGVLGSDGDISYFTYLNTISINEVSHEFLSKFNSKVKFGRAYIDRDGDVTLQMDRNSSGGVSIENIESDFDVFLLLVKTFLTEIEQRGSV